MNIGKREKEKEDRWEEMRGGWKVRKNGMGRRKRMGRR